MSMTKEHESDKTSKVSGDGVLVERWKVTRGRELLFMGQGEIGNKRQVQGCRERRGQQIVKAPVPQPQPSINSSNSMRAHGLDLLFDSNIK